MAIKVSSKFGFLEVGPVELSPSHREDGKSSLKISFRTKLKRKENFGGKSVRCVANHECTRKSEVQELVDQLHFCADNGLLKETSVIHGYVLKSGFVDDKLLVLFNHVIHAYFKCSDFTSAKVVFDILTHKNAFSWTAMIIGSNQQGLFHDGLSYFIEMLNDGIFPDGFAYSAVLQSCIGTGRVDLGDVVHGQIIARGFGSHVIVNTTLLNMYAKLSKIEEAYRVFNSMTEHNDVSWNAMISGFTANGLHLEAFSHFLKMKEQGFVPNVYTLVSVLKAVAMLDDVDKGKQVHLCVSELGLEDNIIVGTSLIDTYSKCGDLMEAKSVFYNHFAHCRVNGPWNAMISGYLLCNCSKQALQLYVKMCENNIKSDLYTFCSVFDAIADLKWLRFAKEVHGMVLKSGYNLMNPNIENAIADAYSKSGSLEEVEKIFNRLKCRDLVSWTTLVTAYSQCGKWEKALIIFSQMRKEGFIPSQFTLASVLTACANLCYLEYGRQIHCLLCKFGCENVRYIESALVDMYAKGGNINEAETIFNKICNPDIVSLTAIISGYAYHGSVTRALWYFKRMEQMHVKPTTITFLCVLFACSHAGLVDEGLHYFRSMERDYCLVPGMEHYACVVDLLGRSGRLHEAFLFIKRMPLEPDEMVWQSFLAACRVHGNVELSKIASEKILSLCTEYSSSTYVLLSNTYMESGDMKGGIGVRRVMKEKGVIKEAGCSWILVRGGLHKFYAGDTNHPQKDHIYEKLNELRKNMKDLDYVPDSIHALLGED